MAVNNNGQDKDLDAVVASLRQSYLDNVRQQKQKLAALLISVQQAKLTLPQKESLTLIGHSFAGNGASYGFQALTDTGRALEQLLLEHQEAPAKEIEKKIMALLKACDQALHDTPRIIAEMPLHEEVKPEKSVLVIDDDKNVVDLVQMLLRGSSIVYSSDNGGDAMRLIYEHRPDLILLDHTLEGEPSGLEILQMVQKISGLKSVPIIMASGNTDPAIIKKCIMAGAIDYLSKPINSKEFHEKVKSRLFSGKGSILVVDDDPTICEMFEKKLSSIGCFVRTSCEGQDAYSQMREEIPDMVILDRMMPGVSGNSLLSMMKQDPLLAGVPIIFLTAKDKQSDVIEGIGMGVVDYIVKPFNLNEATARCMRILQAHLAKKAKAE